MSRGLAYRARRTIVAVTTLAVTVLAFGTVPAASAENAGSRLPPPQRDQLAALFDPELKKLDLHVSRATLQSLDTYRADPNGTHLALYAEPLTDDYDAGTYVANFARLVRLFVPKVFKRWPGLKSFDVCQEATPGADSRPEPPPVTQIFVRRDALDRVASWKHATLTDLLAAVPRDRDLQRDYSVYFRPELTEEPAFQKAAVRSGFTTGIAAASNEGG